MLPLVAALPACWFLFIALRRIRPRRSVSPTSDTSSATSNTVIAISPAVVVASVDPRSRQCPDPTAFFFVLACRASSTGARPTREGGGGGGCCSGWFRHDTGMVVVSSRRLVRRARRARPSCIQSSLNGTRRNRYRGGRECGRRSRTRFETGSDTPSCARRNGSMFGIVKTRRRRT